MTRVNFNPQFSHLNFDKLFSEIPNNFDMLFNTFPKVDLMENKNSVNIVVELPGVSKEDVKMYLADDRIDFRAPQGIRRRHFEGRDPARPIR